MHDLEALPLTDGQRHALGGRLDRVTALIGRELKRAQFAGEGSGQRFVPDRDVAALIAALQRLYQPRDLAVTVGGLPDAALPFDYEDMLELLGNLLDNAFKWARSRVVVDVRFDSELLLRVADDGPGIPLAERAALLQRGSRLDEQEPAVVSAWRSSATSSPTTVARSGSITATHWAACWSRSGCRRRSASPIPRDDPGVAQRDDSAWFQLAGVASDSDREGLMLRPVQPGWRSAGHRDWGDTMLSKSSLIDRVGRDDSGGRRRRESRRV